MLGRLITVSLLLFLGFFVAVVGLFAAVFAFVLRFLKSIIVRFLPEKPATQKPDNMLDPIDGEYTEVVESKYDKPSDIK